MSAHGIKHWTKVLDDALVGHSVPDIAVEYAFDALLNLGVNTDRWDRIKPAAIRKRTANPA